MQILLAILSAFLFALGTVLQQRAGMQEAEDAPAEATSSGILLRMAVRRVWLAGIAFDALGLVMQALALRVGQLAVVQPLLVLCVVFALPLGLRLSGQQISRREVLAAALVVVALAGFLASADLRGGRNVPPLHAWIVAGALCAVACLPFALLARGGSPTRRAALLAAAAGILFALCAALTKAVVDELNIGFIHTFTSWQPYALAAVGYVSMTLNQLALNTGALAATMATNTALDPIVSVLLGLTLFAEHLRGSTVQHVGTFAALAVAIAGMVVLARAESPS